MPRADRPSALPLSPTGPQPLVSTSDDGNKVVASLPSGDRVEVLLHGATVTSWKGPNDNEQLFLSSKAALDGSKAVRGGIPVVFPVFGPPPKDHATSNLPQHGFARNVRWEYLGKTSSESTGTASALDSSVKLDFGLSSAQLDEKSRKAWPHEFSLVYSVTLGTGELGLSLEIKNAGETPWEFTTLLHTYFRIGVSGLRNYIGDVYANGRRTSRKSQFQDSRKQLSSTRSLEQQTSRLQDHPSRSPASWTACILTPPIRSQSRKAMRPSSRFCVMACRTLSSGTQYVCIWVA